MSSKTLWNQKLGMLMACASPGSALAFHLGSVINRPEMLRGTNHMATVASSAAHGAVPGSPETTAAASARGRRSSALRWLSRVLVRVEQWSFRQQLQDRERYLAQAQNVSDLEARMRDLQTSRFWLP